ncbi:MAG TPA: serine hydrolase domain-containing protein [Solirubrobacterales bacterium]
MAENLLRGVRLDRAREVGLDPDALRRAFGLVEAWVEDGVLPGAAALVTRGGVVGGEAYVGMADRQRHRAADSDTIWSLASITKPFTATAVMLLVEAGAFSLDEPLYRLLPDFLAAPETPFDRRAVTLRHVLAHCSGLPGFSEDNLALRMAHRPIEAFVRSFARQPLLFAPGTMHYYSNVGILLAAEVVGRYLAGALGGEVEIPAVGRLYGFVRERILAPLGMDGAGFRPPAEWDERIARVEGTGQEGSDWEMANSAYYRGLGIPWGGLYSTARDLARFVDLFLPGAGGLGRVGLGQRDARILSPASIRAMVSARLAPPDAPADLAPELRDGSPPIWPLPAVEWGIGWEVKGGKRPHWSGELTSAATYGHLGASGTMAWADPETDVACVLLTNQALVSGWTRERPRQAMFGNAVAAAAL